MNYKVSPDVMTRLVDASEGSILRSHVDITVATLFKSTRYLTSGRLVDGIVLTLLLNDEINPDSVDEALAFIQSKTRSFYTSVEREYGFIKDKFLEYAATVVENIDDILALDMRTVNFVAFILAKDVMQKCTLNRDEIYMRAFTYSELLEIDLPHF